MQGAYSLVRSRYLGLHRLFALPCRRPLTLPLRVCARTLKSPLGTMVLDNPDFLRFSADEDRDNNRHARASTSSVLIRGAMLR